MDFLDPKKQRRHTIMLLVGYFLIATAILIGATLLLYLARGFRVKDGEVVQNGLLFVSSAPAPANVYIDGVLKARTNTRFGLEEGDYMMQIERNGYRQWQRKIDVQGGLVDRFDYATLIPKTLTSDVVQTYATAPSFVSQSPDKRWLMLQVPGTNNQIQTYDLKSIEKPPLTITLAEGVATVPTTPNQAWEVIEWSADNRHVLIKHSFDDSYEYLVVNREDEQDATNLNSLLGIRPTDLRLRDKKYDAYYFLNQEANQLQTARLTDPTLATVMTDVVAYKSYGSDILIYVTPTGAKDGEVLIRLFQDGKHYTLRAVPANTTYLLDLARFDRKWYAAVGASSDGRVFIYKNPVSQLESNPKRSLTASQVLRVDAPTYLAFSQNARFIMTENKQQFAVYDVENNRGYSYEAKLPLDNPQMRASWIDGFHLGYVSGGKFSMMDYDQQNRQALMAADSRFGAFLTPDGKRILAFSGQTADPANVDQIHLTTTWLRTTDDR
jgi:hypothetical protein